MEIAWWSKRVGVSRRTTTNWMSTGTDQAQTVNLIPRAQPSKTPNTENFQTNWLPKQTPNAKAVTYSNAQSQKSSSENGLMESKG